MEATGVHLEAGLAHLEDDRWLMLVNERLVKQVPGLKTDIERRGLVGQLAEAGLLRANFVPPKPISDLRQRTQ